MHLESPLMIFAQCKSVSNYVEASKSTRVVHFFQSIDILIIGSTLFFICLGRRLALTSVPLETFSLVI